MAKPCNEEDKNRMVKLWTNHVNLLWSRFKTASAIEAGSLSGAYTIHDLHPNWAAILLLIAAALLFGVLLLMMRDVQYGDAIKKAKKDDSPIPTPDEDLLTLEAWKIGDDKNNKKPFRISQIGGRHIGFCMILILIGLNFLAAWRFSGHHFTCPCLN
jgi:hypothetical protein